MEAADRRRSRELYREVYVAGDALERESMAMHNRLGISPSPCLPNSSSSGLLEQRISVISNTSSNTSGIVSDKLHCSFDESEGEITTVKKIQIPVVHLNNFEANKLHLCVELVFCIYKSWLFVPKFPSYMANLN